jgi:C-terminal processing protease CtpA/Prc
MISSMKRCANWVVFVLFLVAARLEGQDAEAAKTSPDRRTVQKILGFEGGDGLALPVGWYWGPDGTVGVDESVVHSGKRSARIERVAASQAMFSTLTATLPRDFAGGVVELRGFLRLKDVSDFAGLWMREDGDGQTLQFVNMQEEQVHGTADWKEYTVKLPVDARATTLYIGVLMSGTGVLWADDLQLLVDGRPIADAVDLPKKVPSISDDDHEFDGGSQVVVNGLTPMQVANLATLGRVWGLLKYHDRRVNQGQRQWDYDLFRIMPEVLAAKSREEADAAMNGWVLGLGPILDCKVCVVLDPKAVVMKPDLGWLDDGAMLGTALSLHLKRIYVNRQGGRQFYVSIGNIAKNAVFDHELSYSALKFPDAGFQMLALFRFWNMMQYWAPDRDVAGQDWETVLTEFLPKVALAKDKDAFQLVMMELIAKANDTHASLLGDFRLKPPVGDCAVPVATRFIDGEAVVSGYAAKTPEAAGLKVGDVVEALDGIAVKELVERWTPLYGDSNQATRLAYMGMALTRGSCGPVTVRVRQDGHSLEMSAKRVPVQGFNAVPHDLPGETFRLLSKDVAYLKLSTVKVADVAGYIEKAKGTKGLVVDIRNYPSEFVVFALGSLLATRHTEFATFTQGDLANPGAFHFGDVEALDAREPHYGGKVMILVDEATISSAEYTAMALQATPNAMVVGSTTEGADGNVSNISLPGGWYTRVSGLGVFYPDHRPTQRVGVRIDVEVKPTVAGIKAGRDEVLEEGIRRIVGRGVSQEDIETMARH